MFTNQTHLRHVLRPDQYTSEEQYRTELRCLFRPAWHPLAVTTDFTQPGDFLTFDLLETPILIRNCGGELRAFRNVCPHCRATPAEGPRGTAEHFRCRGCRRDLDGGSGLEPFRLGTCRDLVFVNFGDGVPLRDWLDPVWEEWQNYGGAYRHSATWEKDFPCNWKVVLENSLESYHIPEVHPKTFKEFPPEENAWHELTDRFSSFKTIPPRDMPTRSMDWMVRRLGHPVTGEYWHRVLHPHTTGSNLDVFRMMQCVFPTGPRTCRYRCIFFSLRGSARGPLAWTLFRFLKWISTNIAYKVFLEDASIYGGVQRGLEASPHRGVIGTREERIYVFQEYVNRECGLSAPADDPGAAHLPAANGQPSAEATGAR